MNKSDSVVDLRIAETIDVSCSCGWEGIALIPDLKRDYYALCKKCGKKIYGVNCLKCETCYVYPEDDKDVNKEQMTWKCCGWIPLSHDVQNNFLRKLQQRERTSRRNETDCPREGEKDASFSHSCFTYWFGCYGLLCLA